MAVSFAPEDVVEVRQTFAFGIVDLTEVIPEAADIPTGQWQDYETVVLAMYGVAFARAVVAGELLQAAVVDIDLVGSAVPFALY